MDQFEIDESRCVFDGEVRTYPARWRAVPENGALLWPLLCRWAPLPRESSSGIYQRLVALIDAHERNLLVTVAVLGDFADRIMTLTRALTLDGIRDGQWPRAVIVIETNHDLTWRVVALQTRRITDRDLRGRLRALLHLVDGMHRHRHPHGAIHAAGIQVDEDGALRLPVPVIDERVGSRRHCCDYCAPERVRSDPHPPAALASDVWAVACAFLEMTTGLSMFAGVDAGQILCRQIQFHDVPVGEYIGRDRADHDDEFRSMLAMMLAVDEECRAGIHDVVRHRYWNVGIDRRSTICVQPEPEPAPATICTQVCGRSRQWWRKDVLSDDSDDSLSSGGDDDYVGGRITSPVRAGSPAVPTLDELDMNEVRVCVGRWYRQVSGHPGRPSRVLIRLQVGEQLFKSDQVPFEDDGRQQELNVQHTFLMKHDRLVALCETSPLVVLLYGIRDLPHSMETETSCLASAQVDMSALLSGFPFLTGYYHFDKPEFGQVEIRVSAH
ncbi:hypothetical protein PBRA_001345 [Plasmodiophora brassicae]|uniref:Protein kinase domain-containing protein n=1 Tax=Plasmodiophora brassicae TaxID=37360 RepID=A0A0G4IWB6_PLABS|nr:hypothetical protein PBRA_001345 [Plasmodiophora brassicae]